jgi:drug/metabolite transporter (DMT)-like permease
LHRVAIIQRVREDARMEPDQRTPWHKRNVDKRYRIAMAVLGITGVVLVSPVFEDNTTLKVVGAVLLVAAALVGSLGVAWSKDA